MVPRRRKTTTLIDRPHEQSPHRTSLNRKANIAHIRDGGDIPPSWRVSRQYVHRHTKLRSQLTLTSMYIPWYGFKRTTKTNAILLRSVSEIIWRRPPRPRTRSRGWKIHPHFPGLVTMPSPASSPVAAPREQARTTSRAWPPARGCDGGRRLVRIARGYTRLD